MSLGPNNYGRTCKNFKLHYWYENLSRQSLVWNLGSYNYRRAGKNFVPIIGTKLLFNNPEALDLYLFWRFSMVNLGKVLAMRVNFS